MAQRRPLAFLLDDLNRYLTETGRDTAALAKLRYRGMQEAALDRKIPAERVNGRWHFSPDDLPRIAQALGLVPSPARRSSPSNSAAVAA
ncbi:hypothetical protein [Roseomonas chloroacetimidivorans]|uniref:hypothetical protein n=1 Tax=Roseomonas chloroacetimidivorans TaxID=1766656 RepID=UPI003C70F1B9